MDKCMLAFKKTCEEMVSVMRPLVVVLAIVMNSLERFSWTLESGVDYCHELSCSGVYIHFLSSGDQPPTWLRKMGKVISLSVSGVVSPAIRSRYSLT